MGFVDMEASWMSTAPIFGVTLGVWVRSAEIVEGVIAFCAAAMAVLMLPVWPGIRSTLASRSHRFAAVWFTILAGLLLLSALLVRDMLAPDQTFRTVMVIAGLSLAVVGMAIWFAASLRSKGDWILDYEFRGFSGRAVPSFIAACWFGCLTAWIIKVFPQADALALTAAFGCIAFVVLAVVTNIFARPKFLIPVVMRSTPGTLDSRLAARARRKGRPTGGRRIKVPDLVTVIVDRGQDSGWHGWSADLEDLKLDANTLQEIDHAAQTDLHRRFANPGQRSKLSLQFLVEEKSAANLPPMPGVPKDRLFEAKPRSSGGYTAQSVEQPDLELRADNLDVLPSKAMATGSKTVRLTWSHDLAL
jgi:hypothetical protein